MFQLSTNAARALKLSEAVTDERTKPAWGFPSRSMERATRGREDEVANHLQGLLKRGIDFVGAEVLAVSKPKGLRPLSVLSFSERVLYRALTQPLKDELDLPERSYQNYQSFSQAPLWVRGASHIVRADVASFYQYVDHDLLHEEIVNQTGHAGAADSILALLHGLNQKRVGLPQLYDPSDWLSEIMIDRVERSMIRAGYAVFRFNDDFRVACSSWGEANEAILKLDDELRPLGLTLNGDKTMIQMTATYQGWTEAPDQAWSAIADQLGLDIGEPDWEAISVYARVISPLVEDEVEESSDDEDERASDEELRQLWIKAAKAALGIWLSGKKEPHQQPLHALIHRRLLRQALKVLTTARGLEGLEYCKSILTTEQHISHLVGPYLTAAARKDPDAVVDRLSAWIKEGFYLSEWQKLWLMEPLLVCDQIPDPIREWLDQIATKSSSSAVRGRALSVLTYKSLIDPKAAATQIDLLADPSAKDLTAAIAHATGGTGRLTESLRKRDFLTRLVVEAAIS